MDLKLSGRTALVTGSSKGIGLAVANWLAREGVNVGLVARTGDRLEKEGAALGKATGVNVRTLAADLSDAAARERVAAAFPDVDLLINNAGVEITSLVIDVKPADLSRMCEVNIVGVGLGMKHAFRAMKPDGAAGKGGAIVSI